MDSPAVQYVTTSNGVSIAYLVSGHGTPLLFLPGSFQHGLLGWQYPGLQNWLRGLANDFKLIQIDPRGFGMSGRDVGEDIARADYLEDIEAVVRLLKLERFPIVAFSTAVELAAEYALRHPEQVTALVLGASMVSSWSTALFDLLPEQDWDAFLYSIVPRDRDREERERIVELHRQDKDQRNYLLRSHHLWRDPDAYAKYAEGILSALRTEVLVLHPREYALMGGVEQSIKKAQLCRGRLVVIDGTDVWGDADQGIRAVTAFLAALEPQPLTHPERTDRLSDRETQVLRLVAEGKTNQQISDELVISAHTVGRHMSNIFDKIGVANRAQATAYAKDHGLA
jgi:ATP/maltotriose-dependent transcriptional regulator MalT